MNMFCRAFYFLTMRDFAFEVFFVRNVKMSFAPLPSQTWGSPSVVPIPSDWNPLEDGAALLIFSMDGCPWCIRLAPTAELVAKTLGSVVPVYKVGPENRLTRAMSVTGFPTIKFVDAFGQVYDYKGERTADAISSFVCSVNQTKNSVCSKYF